MPQTMVTGRAKLLMEHSKLQNYNIRRLIGSEAILQMAGLSPRGYISSGHSAQYTPPKYTVGKRCARSYMARGRLWGQPVFPSKRFRLFQVGLCCKRAANRCGCFLRRPPNCLLAPVHCCTLSATRSAQSSQQVSQSNQVTTAAVIFASILSWWGTAKLWSILFPDFDHLNY